MNGEGLAGLTGGNGGEPLSYTYSPFGVSTPSATQGVPQNQLQFTGALQDNASNPDGIDHMGARFYDPSVGRWTQQDPISNPASPQNWDRYVYVGDDPVNDADPNGEQCSAGAALGAAFGLAGGAESIGWGVEATNFVLGGAAVEVGATALELAGIAIGAVSLFGIGALAIGASVYLAMSNGC